MRGTIVAVLSAILLGLVLVPSETQACDFQDIANNNCQFGASGAAPPSADAVAQVTSMAKAFATQPKITGTMNDDKLFYNLIVDNACGPGSVNEMAEEFIKGAAKNFPANLFVNEKRAIALTMTISFTESATPNTATIPLVALANDDKTVNKINCNNVILKGVPINQPLLIATQLISTTNYEAGNASALITSIGTALAGVAYLGPHTATGAVSVLTFAKGIDVVNKATIDFVKLIKPNANEISKQYRMNPQSLQMAYGPGKKPLLVMKKELKNTNIFYTAEQPLTVEQGINQAYEPAKALSQTYGKQPISEALALAQQTPTAQNLSSLCNRLVAEVTTAYNGDQGAIALAIYFYLYQKQDMFVKLKATCLTTPHIDLLKKLGFKTTIYEGMFDPNLASKSQQQGGPSEGVTDAIFNETKNLMDALASQLKNLPASLASTDPAVTKRAIDLLTGLFYDEVAVAGQGVGLLPQVEGKPRGEVVDLIKSWGAVARFGCYSKPKSTFAIKRNVTGEALALFPDRKLLALFQVGKSSNGPRIERLEVSKADVDAVTRLLGDRQDCGSTEYGWNPRKDFDALSGAVATMDMNPSHAVAARRLTLSVPRDTRP